MADKNYPEAESPTHGGDIISAACFAGLAPDMILDFSSSINPLGPPPGLYDFLEQNLPAITRYPDPLARRLCAAIKAHYRPDADFVPGNGAAELIFLLLRALSPRTVLLPAPTFSLYERAAQSAGSRLIFHQLTAESRFRLEHSRFCTAVREWRPELVFLCHPNNPTGELLEREQLLAIAKEVNAVGGLLVVDEAFLEFREDYRRRTLLAAASPDNVVVLCSLTKMFAIPGLRLGFMAGPPQVINAVRAVRDPWSVNALAQLAGEFVLAQEGFVEKSAAAVSVLGKALFESLSCLPWLTVYQPTVNYLFLESSAAASQELQRKLLSSGILIRDCSNFRGLDSRHLRVAVRTAAENARLAEALALLS
ncbi:MAG: Threonine-phosphate decarboxylase [Syntrophomonadaceae bacterium]|nr:Threonine-phosphate decarboxylase [Bacillota bacterium]